MKQPGCNGRQRSKAARAASLGNRHAKQLGRDAANRLEPECFPALKPKFKFAPGASVFTVGSCFARNIETRLAQLGFQVPTLQVDDTVVGEVGVNLINKYTPASIWQELSWAHGIRRRDGVVADSDVQALFLDLGGGKVADLHLYPLAAVDYDFAMRRRKAVFKVFNAAFNSDVVTITLGLIEAWFDSETGLYVIRCPEKFFSHAPERFLFERLNFAQCKSFVDRTIELLQHEGCPKKILLTTSPVVLGRTFTGDDVIVANCYSKSVLRAVAGQICEENDSVDYFPAFESVVLTKQEHVWEDNLTHVSKEFVAKIIDRVVSSYVDRQSASAVDELKLHDCTRKIADLVLAGNLVEAAALYESVRPRALDLDGHSWHAAGAAVALKLGDTGLAHRHASKAMSCEPTAPHFSQLLVDVLRELGMAEDAATRAPAVTQSGGQVSQFAAGDRDDAHRRRQIGRGHRDRTAGR